MDTEVAKRAAGEAAAALVRDGSVVGLGTGSTARWFIAALGRQIREGMEVRGVPTSRASEALARDAGIPVIELGDGIDLAVDGADIVDADLRLVKGRGGAMVREKIVASAARRFIVIVDQTKVQTRLSGPVPVEVVPFGARATLAALTATGARFTVRRSGAPGDAALISDNGNLIADGEYGGIDDAEGLAARLDAIPGVVGHGLFLGMADLVIVGYPDGRAEQLQPAG